MSTAPRTFQSVKPILCMDFDGVIHSYSSGWQGASLVPDPPVEGALEFLAKASEAFEVHVYSSRSHEPGGIEAMQSWLWKHVTGEEYKADETTQCPVWLLQVKWPTHKPSAAISIDDRALTFEGPMHWPTIEALQAFQPWNKR